MLLLVIGLIVFLGIHLLPTVPQIRNGLVDRFGEPAYKIAFSIIALAGFALIVIGYGKVQGLPSKNPELWNPPLWTRHIAFALMPFSLVMLAAAYIPSNIKRILKHPMLAAVKVWALAHLLANGDAASVVLFGSFLAYAIYDRISVKHRVAAVSAAQPEGGIGGDVVAVGVGLAAYVFMLMWGHHWLIGVPLISR